MGIDFFESPAVFRIEDDELAGVLSQPKKCRSNIGLLIVVGGPQYRIGSHRQFVQMCRVAAQSGITAFRFDVRGMGDSAGQPSSFEDIGLDINRAIDFLLAKTGLNGVVLWGLCDGASALALSTFDERVKGLIMLNPWVHEDSLRHKAYVETYYKRKFLDLDTYKRLFNGDLDVTHSLRELLCSLKIAYVKDDVAGREGNVTLLSRVTAGIRRQKIKKTVILSGNDLTANEFESGCLKVYGKSWAQHLQVCVFRISSANHTFSNPTDRKAVERATIDFFKHLDVRKICE